MLKLGVIGLGAISPFYLKAVATSSDFRLTAVADRIDARKDRVTGHGVHGFHDYEDLLRSGDVDAVIINLPNNLHHPAAMMALACGKHVCCEKPLTLSVSDARALGLAAAGAGRTLFTAFHRRYNVAVQRLKTQLSQQHPDIDHVDLFYQEDIREHTGGDSWYLKPDSCGGGCIADNGPNAFDTLAYLFGSIRVLGARSGNIRNGAEYSAQIDVVLGDGIPGSVHLSWDYDRGEDKTIVIKHRSGHATKADMLEGFPAFKSSLDHEYEAILADFAAEIRNNTGRGEAGLTCVELVAESYRLSNQHDGAAAPEVVL